MIGIELQEPRAQHSVDSADVAAGLDDGGSGGTFSDAGIAPIGASVDDAYLISLVQHVLVSQRAQNKFYFQVGCVCGL